MKIYWTLKSLPELNGLNAVERSLAFKSCGDGGWPGLLFRFIRMLAAIFGLTHARTKFWPNVNMWEAALCAGVIGGFLAWVMLVLNLNLTRPRFAAYRAKLNEKTPV